MDTNKKLRNFYDQQIAEWPGLKDGITALEQVQEKWISLSGDNIQIQYNPLRKINVTAKVVDAVDSGSCFLCASQRPKEQRSISFEKSFLILCNPRPIFKEHFTIVHNDHRPQSLKGFFDTMKAIASKYTDYAVFYNGAKSGASAPFHLHFQMAPKAVFPICTAMGFENDFAGAGFSRELNNEKVNQDLLNVIVWSDTVKGLQTRVFKRKAHRPKCYFDNSFIVSPACVELGGVWVTVRAEDFEKADSEILKRVVSEVSV